MSDLACGYRSRMETSEFKHVLDRAGPFASVLIDVSLDAAEGEEQLTIAAKDVANTLQASGAPRHTAELVSQAAGVPVSEPAPQSRYILADADGILVNDLLSERTPTVQAEWESLPNLAAPLTAAQARVDFVLVEVDHEGGQVSTYRGNGRRATATESTGVENEHVHKRREGGLAHMQYQRIAEEGWRDRAREVAELAEKHVHRGYELVVVAGSIESRKEVVENLAGWQAEVIELERSARNPDRGDQEMDDDIDVAVNSYLQERHDALISQAHERLGQGHYATGGLDDVIGVLARAQVETLLLDWQRAREESIRVKESHGVSLPQVTDGTQVRADLLVTALGVRTDARIVPVSTDEIGGEPVAALLRWS